MENNVTVVNRKAYYDYHILETLEVGIVLTGSEVKSIRAGKVNLRDSYAKIEDGEVWLVGTHIALYEQANRFNHDPQRPRKLLLHKDEILRLKRRLREGGYTLVPTKLYMNQKGLAKLDLAQARGKKLYDKRESIAQKESQRQIERAVRSRLQAPKAR